MKTHKLQTKKVLCHWVQDFVPVSTGSGFCQSFNSLPYSSIYQDSRYVKHWPSVFNIPNTTDLKYPIVWGPSRDLYIILQSYEQYPARIRAQCYKKISSVIYRFS
jgi:hypothetical protein